MRNIHQSRGAVRIVVGARLRCGQSRLTVPTSSLSQKRRHSLISKTMETVITKQLPTFLETNNLLSDHQCDFRKPDQLVIFWLMPSMFGPLLEKPMVRAESFLLTFLSPLIASGTRVFSLNYRSLIIWIGSNL